MGDFHINQTQFCKASLTQNPRDKGTLPLGEAGMDPNSLLGDESSTLALEVAQGFGEICPLISSSY